MLEILFWLLAGILFYTYAGYTLVLLCLRFFKKNRLPRLPSDDNFPEVSMVVAAYNEAAIAQQKINNCRQLNYPKEKLQIIWVTDGSDDGTEKIIAANPDMICLHSGERKGKTAAINRAMKFVKTPVTVFSDANTFLTADSVKWLAAALSDMNVGCAAGEKRIVSHQKDTATGSGEGFYWNYESFIKKLESHTGSTLSAAGEIYAIKTELYSPPAENTVIDDFVISLQVALKGYKISYVPQALATEQPSASIGEESKRKIRIAAGAFQVLFSWSRPLNIFRYPMLAFQYISHKLFRWLLAPLAIPFLFVVNLLLVITGETNTFYQAILAMQTIVYLLALFGYLMRKNQLRWKGFFLPYYLLMMNYATLLGFYRYLKGSQHAAWEKAKRKE